MHGDPLTDPAVLRAVHAVFVRGIRVGAGPHAALLVTASRAAVLGLGGRKGGLPSGYDADILAVNGAPLTDPAVLHTVHAVFVRSHRVRLSPPPGSRDGISWPFRGVSREETGRAG